MALTYTLRFFGIKKILFSGIALAILASDAQAGLLDRIFGRSGSVNTNTTDVTSETRLALSNDQIVLGLKEALGNGVQNAVAQLGREGGFTTNLNVRIPMPESLRNVEKTLRTLKQERLADEFVLTMNRAAEKAVPEAAEIFSGAIKKMTIQDATSILLGTNDAATQYFRRVTETNLQERFLPIVKQTTESSGVTSAYKQLTASVNTGRLGSFTRALGGIEPVDVDSYVTQKALDGLFKVIAEEEQRIRENPSARGSELLQKVFGAVKRAGH